MKYDHRIAAIRDRLGLERFEFDISCYSGPGHTPAVNSRVTVRMSDSRAFNGWEQGKVAGYVNGADGLQACVLYTERGDNDYKFVPIRWLRPWKAVRETELLLDAVSRLTRPAVKSKIIKVKTGKQLDARRKVVIGKKAKNMNSDRVLETKEVLVADPENGDHTYVFRKVKPHRGNTEQYVVSIRGHQYVKATIYKTDVDWAATIYINVGTFDEPNVYAYPQYAYEAGKISAATPGEAFVKARLYLEQQVRMDFPRRQLQMDETVYVNGSKWTEVFGFPEWIATFDCENE